MKAAIRVALCMGAGLWLVSCAQKGGEGPAAVVSDGAATVFDAMNATIIPSSNVVWELAGGLYNDDGELEAGLLTAEQWTQLADAATAMGSAAKKLAQTAGLKVVPAGGKIQSEGTEGAASAADVQNSIDANPQGFSEHAMKLATVSDEIAAAAVAHDAMKTDDAQARMTDVCGECHAAYWYPKQAGE